MVLREKFQGSNPGWQVLRVISTETDQINGALPLVLRKMTQLQKGLETERGDCTSGTKSKIRRHLSKQTLIWN